MREGPFVQTVGVAEEEQYETRDSIADIWGARTPFSGEGQWPARVDERALETPERWVQSTCLLCSNDCGMDIGVRDNRIVAVRGRGVDRVNRGRLGPKGLHGSFANSSPDRLRRPLIKVAPGQFREGSWDEAMGLVAQRAKEIRDRYTAQAIGFYTSGQLFLEEYYLLAMIAKAGLGTPHTDGNTRLCTAAAAEALIETFGTDGQPGSYEDFDVCDTIFHAGHNIAEQQTVLWMRILDRRRGPNPPRMVVLDPRNTYTAQEADVWLDPYPGTNVPVLNGLLNLIIQNGQIDPAYIEAHTVGFGKLKATVAPWTPERVEVVSGVSAAKLRAAAGILGSAQRLFSTVLQGVYQSNQATAAAIQVNNLQLIRGMIGKPGCGVLQMNGQPTSQNTRECGDNGAFTGFRNWDNEQQMEDLARCWNIDPQVLPAYKAPTHAMELFRYARQGVIKMLWICATNPAVSLPDLPLIRDTLQTPGLFLVAQDAWMNETTQYADIVLPAAIWGEKTGTYTNTDRTVHISYKAIDPPGEARSDFDILLDFARRMDLRDRDGAPLVKFQDPEGAFESFKRCTAGRPCDYTGITYARLTGGSGIPYPVDEKHPDGTVRLYTGGVFNTAVEYCESYGRDMITGAPMTEEEYRAHDPKGRAFLKAADYVPPDEVPDEHYPFWFTTGRIVYHWQTRTKTGRSPELNQRAPDTFIQISLEDAGRLGIRNGDWVEIESRRGRAIGTAMVGNIKPGVLFMPFHFGYWDYPDRPRAGNELTIPGWDPLSKQPFLKFGAARVHRVVNGSLAARAAQVAQKAAQTAMGARSVREG